MTHRSYRVVQWATGNIGTRALRAVLEHPQLTLAGVFVHSPQKVGRDAGELCGLGPTGVIATSDVEEIIDLRPDCVLYTPRACDFDELCRMLESGSNVVTTRGEFHRPASLESDTRRRVETACELGGASIHSTGSSPGFITEALPLVLTSIERRLDCLTIDEYADLSSRESPGLLFEVMGFGSSPADFDRRRLTHGRASFGPSLELVADALSMPLDAVEASGEIAVTPRRVEIAAGPLGAGTVAAQRMVVAGLRGGRTVLQFRATWYCVSSLEPAWETHPTGWHVRVDGDVPLDVRIQFPVAPEEWAATSPGLTAHRAVNAVPVVCDAPTGIRTTVDLPQILANLG